MADPIRISLRYIGPEVDSGEMDIDEVVTALAGFSKAYSKVASEISPTATHQLKVTALRESSFDVFISAMATLNQYGDAFKQIENVVNAAKFVFSLITSVINCKKHVKGSLYTFNVDGKNNTVNVEHVEINVPREAFEMFAQKVLDNELNKIVAPLSQRGIDSAELKDEQDSSSGVTIKSTERDYFRLDPASTSFKETEVTGKFISLNKERNSGRFELKNGERVPYRYIGENRDQFHAEFSRRGQVRALVDAELNESLEPISLNIKAVIHAQTNLSLPESEGSETK
jgi:hypothetical protein